MVKSILEAKEEKSWTLKCSMSLYVDFLRYVHSSYGDFPNIDGYVASMSAQPCSIGTPW